MKKSGQKDKAPGKEPNKKSESKEKDSSSSILDSKKHPHRLIAEEGVGVSEDANVIQLTQKKMDELKIFKSETILLKGKKGKETICYCLPDNSGLLNDDKIRIGKVARNNLRIRLGDPVSIHKCQTILIGNSVHILPFEDTIEGISDNLAKTFLIPYFRDAYRPVHEGDTFICRGGFKSVEFKVIETDPEKYCIVGPQTVIIGEGEPLKREEEEEREDFVEYISDDDNHSFQSKKIPNEINNNKSNNNNINKINNIVKNNNEVSSLQKQLDQANQIIEKQILYISELENKFLISEKKMKDFENIIKQKDLELNNLKTKLNNIQINNYNQINNINVSNNNYYINIKDMMCVNFISSDQRIHFAVACVKSNIFAEIEEQLYKQYPAFRETNNTFLANGTIVLRFKTIAENKIGNGLPVTLIVPN